MKLPLLLQFHLLKLNSIRKELIGAIYKMGKKVVSLTFENPLMRSAVEKVLVDWSCRTDWLERGWKNILWRVENVELVLPSFSLGVETRFMDWEMVCCNTALYLRCQIDLVDWFGGFCFSKKKTGPRRAQDWLLLWWSSKLSQDYDGVHFCCVHALAPISKDQGTLGPSGTLAASGLGGGGVELSLLALHFWLSWL